MYVLFTSACLKFLHLYCVRWMVAWDIWIYWVHYFITPSLYYVISLLIGNAAKHACARPSIFEGMRVHERDICFANSHKGVYLWKVAFSWKFRCLLVKGCYLLSRKDIYRRLNSYKRKYPRLVPEIYCIYLRSASFWRYTHLHPSFCNLFLFLLYSLGSLIYDV